MAPESFIGNLELIFKYLMHSNKFVYQVYNLVFSHIQAIPNNIYLLKVAYTYQYAF